MQKLRAVLPEPSDPRQRGLSRAKSWLLLIGATQMAYNISTSASIGGSSTRLDDELVRGLPNGASCAAIVLRV
jgi:hypothetical protein